MIGFAGTVNYPASAVGQLLLNDGSQAYVCSISAWNAIQIVVFYML